MLTLKDKAVLVKRMPKISCFENIKNAAAVIRAFNAEYLTARDNRDQHEMIGKSARLKYILSDGARNPIDSAHGKVVATAALEIVSQSADYSHNIASLIRRISPICRGYDE